MSARGGLLTSESVSAGHPDKIRNLIFDAILDAFLAQYLDARVACETFVADRSVIEPGITALVSALRGRKSRTNSQHSHAGSFREPDDR